jgi:aminopeptidase N
MSLEHRHHARCGRAGGHASEERLGEGRPFAFATSPRQFERDRPFLVDHLALDLALDVAKKSIRAVATLSVRRVDPDAESITLDAIGFVIASAKIDAADVPYSYDGRALTLSISRRVDAAKISVAYSATPRRGLYFIQPDEHYPARPTQVWSQCQEEDARYFIPCHDKPHVKMTSEVKLRVPNGWFALSNGDLVRDERPADPEPWSFHYRLDQPHPSYLLTVVAGEFAELKAAAGKVPVAYFVPRGREDDGARTFERTPDMIAHFGGITGVEYPWTRYSQVVVSDFIFGGMENTTATTLYEHVLLDPRAAIDVTSDDLIAHELAHQWFGDYVTCRDWSEAWLNEGFATYMEHVWRERALGTDEYDYGIKGDLDAYLGEAHGRYRRSIVCHDYDAPLDLFDRHLYEKGCLVLHMLRLELGTAVFWRGVTLYLTRHARSVVETRDLMRALEEVSGKSLGRFFEQWVHKAGHPEIEGAVAWDKGVLTISVKQHQSTTDGVPNAFELLFCVDILDAHGPRRVKLRVSQRVESFAIACATRPTYVVLDPEMRIAGDVRIKVPSDMLRAQLAQAQTGRGRWIAARALADSDDPPTLEALEATLQKTDEFWGVRVEAAQALGQIRGTASFEALARARSIEHPKVRRAVADALGRFRTTAFETLVDVIDRPAWADVISAGAIDGLAALRDDRGMPHLVARTRYGHPARMRRAAVLALPKLASDRKCREILEDLLDDPDTMLRLDVARALGEVGDGKARPALRARIELELDPRVRRRLREAVRDLSQEGKRTHDGLRDDVDKLQAEHAELRGRIAALEARALGHGPDKKLGAAKSIDPARKKPRRRVAR